MSGTSIRKIGELYRVIARIRDQQGRIVQRQKTLKLTKEEAKALLEKFKGEIRQGQVPCSLTSKVFGELLRLYGEKHSAIAQQDRDRLAVLEKDLGLVSLVTFPNVFEQYVKLKRTACSKRTGRPLSNGSINRVVEMARRVFNMAVKLELLEKNPLSAARFPKLKETPRDRFLAEGEISRLLAVIQTHRPHILPVVQYALQVPCRKSELVNMRKVDLDLIHNAIRIPNGTTKNGAGCWKPIPPDMVVYFRNIPNESEYLFFRYEGRTQCYKPLGDFKRAFRWCLAKAGIQDFHFHDTRHISATALLDNGTPEQVVLTTANWKTNMLKTYYHRDGKRALGLIRFSPNCESSVQTQEAEAA